MISPKKEFDDEHLAKHGEILNGKLKRFEKKNHVFNSYNFLLHF